MSFTFRPAVRENVGLLIGLAGGTGSGKTYTAMRLAKGMAGDKPFAVIDTEAGRAKHYADLFQFYHGDLTPPFTPSAYADAIKAADDAKYPVIVVDSFSHEHAGEGGILDMQEAEYQRMGAREAVKLASWVKPKTDHRRMVSRLLQVRAHLILCFRAEEKIEMVKGQDGKMEVRKKQTATGLDGWIPIAEKNLPYELTASFLLMATKPGVPLPIKLQEQHRPFFPLTEPITEKAGEQLAAWARGGSQVHPAPSGTSQRAGAPAVPLFQPPDEAAARAGLLAELARLGKKLSPQARTTLKVTHLGDPKADMETADLAALTDLVNAARLLAGESSVTPASAAPVSNQPGAGSSSRASA
jgi:hypothetical protein